MRPACLSNASLNRASPSPHLLSSTADNASREYTLGTDAAGSVVNCTVRTVDPYTAVDMPFSFVLVDDEAAVSGQVSIDGVTADDWLHYRPVHATGPVHFPDEYMHWYVAVDDARELRTDCVQYYDNTPGDGGNSTVSHGMRDYSRDFDAAAGADWALYAPPDGVTCTDVTGSAAEPRPVSWTSSRWGGF